MKASGLNEFNNFFTSFPAWMKQLTNAFLLPYSNGYTERTNNKIKVLKQISYGLRHFGRFRVRIPLLSKKNGTNHTYDWCQRKHVGYLKILNGEPDKQYNLIQTLLSKDFS